MPYTLTLRFRENGFGFVRTVYPTQTTATMSASSWRQREIEKARLRKEQAARAEEEARTKSIQKTETNFPSIVGSGSQQRAATFGTSFSTMAQGWATQEKVDQRMAEYRVQKAALSARENAVHGAFFVPRRRRPLHEDEGEEETYQDEQVTPSDDDWTEVRHTKAKGQRELTTSELEQMYRDRGAPEEGDDGEYNHELYDRD